MNKLLARLKEHRLELTVVFSLFGVIMSSISLTYAWISPARDIYDQNNQPGQLDSDLDIWYWNKASANANKWVSSPGVDSVIFGLGEMTSIIELPDDCDTFMKFRINETAITNYQYKVLEENIVINISNSGGPKTVATVDYFEATPSQKCFDYYYYVGVDNLNPTSVFADLEQFTANQFTAPAMYIGADYINQDQYLYLMLKPRLTEIQNIIIEIPIIYSPYALSFAFSFVGEIRTIDV